MPRRGSDGLRTVVMVVSLVAAGCPRGRQPVPAEVRTVDAGVAARRVVRDGMGRAVSLPAEVRRVISLAPSSTEVMYALGAGPLLVGLDKYSDYPPAVATVDKVGANLDPSMERIAALRPDVILAAKTANSQRNVEAMERLGLPVYVSRTDSLEQVFADVRHLAEVVGRGAEGERLASSLEARVAQVRARVAGAPPTPTLVVVWPDPLQVAGPTTHVDDLIRAAGGANLAAASTQDYPTYSLERMIAQAPRVIVVGTHADANLTVPASFAALTTIPAVRDHRVHAVDGDLLFRPGPRVVDGIEELARLLHPERAAPPVRGDGGSR